MNKKRLIKLSIILTICLVLLLIIYFGMSFLNKPSVGAIVNAPSVNNSVTGTNSIDLSPKAVNGQYVSFSYPTGMTVEANSKIVAPVMAMYNYSYRDIESWNLAIAILYIPSGNLSDNNAYQYRKINPDTYQETQTTINGKTIPVMSDSSAVGFSKVAFLVNGHYQATVSLIGNDSDGLNSLQSTFDQVLNTWTWHVQ